MKRNLLLLATLLAIAGCSKGPTTTVPGKNAAGISVVGHYKGAIKKNEAAKDDPAAKMAEAMGEMFAGMMQLDILEGGKFTMSMMAIPIEGSYVLDGNNITLTPKKVAGMTPEEAKKANPTNEVNTEPLKGNVSADGKSITIVDKDPKKSQLIFTQQKEVAPGPKTVANEENELVGNYAGNIQLPPTAKDDEKKMAAAMAGNLTLKLREDNTFKLNIMLEMDGKWSRAGDKLMIKPEKVMGMSMQEAKSKGTTVQDMVGTISADGKTITITNAKGGDQAAFVFKKKASESR